MTDNEKQIQELEQERAKLYENAALLGVQIEILKLKDYDYTGQFISIDDVGSMYVTWQKIDSRDADKIILQGFAYSSCITPYPDSFFININAMQEWNFSVKKFEHLISAGKLKVITPEEFYAGINDSITKLKKEYNYMLDACSARKHKKSENKLINFLQKI